MMRACSLCGGIHPYNQMCRRKRTYQGDERKLRATNAWKQKSLEIRERANHLCEVCRDQGRLTYDLLEVHHIEKLRDNNDLLLANDNLICLCQEHHRQADDGEIPKEYLKELARRREG